MQTRAWLVACSIAFATLGCKSSNGGGGGSGGASGASSSEAGITGWPVQFGTEQDIGNSIATDSQGNVYVTGSAGTVQDAGIDGGEADACFVTKYDPTGARIWFTEVLEPACAAIAVDSASGAIYVAGGGGPVNGHGSALLLKFDATGKQLWEQTLGSTMPNLQAGGAGARAMTLDPSGNILIAGVSDVPLMGASPVSVGNGDILLAKYDPSGKLLWVTLLGSTESATTRGISDYVNAIATDSQGNAYVAADVYGTVAGQVSAGEDDFGVAKFDPNGKNLWLREIGSPTLDEPLGVAVDASGNVYAAGTTLGAIDGHTNAGDHDIFLVKYDTDGTKQWSQQIGGTSSDVANGVALDAKGQPLLVGESEGDFDGHTNVQSNGGTGDVILLKYDTMGNKLYSTEYGSDGGEGGNAIAIDPKGISYVTGNTAGSLRRTILDGGLFNNPPLEGGTFIARFDASGKEY